jgi:hypothetical protein
MERTPDTNCKGDWVGPRSGMDEVVKKKSQPLPGIEQIKVFLSE